MAFLLEIFESTGSGIFWIYDAITGSRSAVRRGTAVRNKNNQIGFFSWLLGWNNTPRVGNGAASTASSPPGVRAAGAGAPRRRRRVAPVVKVQAIRQQQQEDEETAAEVLEAAMVERQIEEDERRAEETMTKSEPQGTGYMVLALQEQLMQLKAQIEAIQSVAPPPPPRDDLDEEESHKDGAEGAPLVPPPPPPSPPAPYQTPAMLRQVSVEKMDAEEPAPSIADQIRENRVARLKDTGIPRSPGGTPMRREMDLANCSNQSPGKFIASALQKKFKSVRLPMSPARRLDESDHDSDWDENEPPKTPAFSTPL